ncbi:hypothetical protein [Pseudobacter ginsenosidimutans]|uniref:Uncharacterized protein n=1 Tax=Pseudobacter ginsenosidimutans TaxID=661488 RepID=A0A4Q7MUQ7_9BACT|nr:hypothetical protein [Pseudobacter ginsenosidimutans]RZS72625.1 hypothetical protein EV199_4547 [Pseudobacter ginsenosidimutans]
MKIFFTCYGGILLAVYGAFWGGQLLSDFQERLLQVIRKRC